ncbi:hypothetical protein BX600DRAFT_408383 [Xylariales sp. PMI_506]|nr:hypothetical protein BX600DRAFT_408383 [Xylariales sp. PMI_506]
MAIGNENERELDLAYELLIELFSHQFAFPVQWIDTQDQLLKVQGVERIIEIGPSSTLKNMTQRTLDHTYKDYDKARSLQRKVLSCDADADELYYKKPPEIVEPEREPEVASIPDLLPSEAAADLDQGQGRIRTNGDIPTIADIPVPAGHILRIIVAKKLNRLTKDVSFSRSICSLSGGRSVLQNEIIGDLMSEFGSLPDRPEELQLEHLSQELQQSFNGKLGKQSSSLINKMVASKLPAGFGLAALRQHMKDRWGFPEGHQNCVLLSVSVDAPESRFPDKTQAVSLIDEIVLGHVRDMGIQSLTYPSSQNTMPSPQVLTMDPKTAQRVENGQRVLSQRLVEVYKEFSGDDLHRLEQEQHAQLKSSVDRLQQELDKWTKEHGDAYASGVAPMMSPDKARVYDSWWNWTVLDLVTTYHDIVTGRLAAAGDTEEELDRRVASISNRSSPAIANDLSYLEERAKNMGNSQTAAHAFLTRLSSACKVAWTRDPVFRTEIQSMAPRTVIDTDGNVNTSLVPRQGVQSLQDYVFEMQRSGGTTTPPDNDNDYLPTIHLKIMTKKGWKFDNDLTNLFLQEMGFACSHGRSFAHQNILVTGAGSGSIGSEVLKGLLRGGAQVVATTSGFSSETAAFFRDIYAGHGSRGSKLILIPFNQGSQQDIESLVRWIYDPKDGLGWDLDAVLPFAAITEQGRDIDGLGSTSELAHRVMLTNTIRLLGAIKRQKINAGQPCRPAQVILPLSPNHGLFGGDGLYSESKMGLESLFRKSESEGWADYLTICGAVIGWTRSTGLMSTNDIVAEGIECLGVRTFSQDEMAFNLLCLMTPYMAELCQTHLVSADLGGNFHKVGDFKAEVTRIRKEITDKGRVAKLIKREDNIEAGIGPEGILGPESFTEKSNTLESSAAVAMSLDIPDLGDFQCEVQGTSEDLHGLVDLERVVVVTGFAELGPFGNSRTRWQVESRGKLSSQGCIELAWVMGLITYHRGFLKGTKTRYCGWVDTKTGQPVRDMDVRELYEKHILQHTGIRLVEPTLWAGYDPHRHPLLQEVVLEADLSEFETSYETALDFKRKHGSKVDVSEVGSDDGQCRVRLRKGATLMIPKAIDFDSLVTGQLPTGWDPRTYGISEDIVSQVDRTTLYALICTAEAFISAGITDPYEVYQHVHLTEVGNCIGAGIGGVVSMNKMRKARYRDEAVQGDILQETFVNTIPAWVNMLLLSSCGPLRTPVGACATALESLDTAHDLIVTRKARICVVGGVDDLEEDTSFEFAQMKATVNGTAEMEKRGRTPREMSRPTASSRAGFVESQGCGIQVVMSADLALEMGVPIYGIVAFTGTCSDKASRSIPAPGKGLLGNARETCPALSNTNCSPMLDIKYRQKKLTRQKARIEAERRSDMEQLADERQVAERAHDLHGVPFDAAAFILDRKREINHAAQEQTKEAMYSIGNQFWQRDAGISPIRGALAVWGLTVDEIDVASFHGTSTLLNEQNELDILQRQFEHLGRAKGNRVLGVFQKHLTGHTKGAAGALMLNGCLQIAQTGLVPGNSNADNIEAALRKFDHVVVPSRSVQTDLVRALSVTSFGFGQKGGQAIVIHPRYLYAAAGAEVYDRYRAKVAVRRRRAEQFLEDGMINNALISLKTNQPFAETKAESDEEATFRAMLNPTARLPVHHGV